MRGEEAARHVAHVEHNAAIKEAQERLDEQLESIDQDVDPRGEEIKGFGGKTIGFWGSFCLNLNNCMGPAMVLLPLLNQQAGWVMPTIALAIMFVLSSLAATMLCEAMQRIPGNFTFEHRFEFATVVKHYYGKRWYIVFQVLYNISLQAFNIAAMIISAEVFDKFIFKIAGHTYALQYQDWPFSFIEYSNDAEHPWCRGDVTQDGCADEYYSVISIGFIVCMAICIPFGYLNLDENMWFQWLSLVGLVVFTVEFLVQFVINMSGSDKMCLHDVVYNETCNYHPDNAVGNFTDNGVHRTPPFHASASGQANVIGMAVFAYSYVVTIPSWVNEKKHRVSVNKAVWVPAIVGLFMKVVVGLLGGWAYWLVYNNKPREGADDILNILVLQNQPQVTQYSAYLWDVTTLIPGIPVLAIMIRYNLLNGRVCNRFWSFFWGVVFPWIVTMFCYERPLLTTFCNWIAIAVQGYINFVVPALLYRSALLRYPDHFDQEAIKGEPRSRTGHFVPLQRRKSMSRARRRVSQASINERSALIRTLSTTYEDEDDLIHDVEEHLDEMPVDAIPPYVFLGGRLIWLNRLLITNIMIAFFTVLSTAAIILNLTLL
ncbi:hypothetical protein PTSG_07549 [Salpingoeca rosetta]|uniref:Amino acid transporter transmembrane domain-containing protein n=1 Tax=Salpingoeca rosetta (strain ATCC 50818 / BSB-021) TaxID=946362 RepID=F2UH33_SALR5|nr:uncharacterized protein PTSG_07549 [Salpingoeca rosetta]EGD76432.1 hypothetical protein PTSG_07549 [Salpingoeca rosetta]|eukprot:XP_004991347.1 hypothetical protein PTSG_07549 [Salpingoeca rosetta]